MSTVSLSSFEKLPPTAVGNILAQLTLGVGAEETVNQADMHTVMRSALNLAFTSKTMYDLVHSTETSRIFFNSLSDKFHKPYEHYLLKLETHGARRLLWKEIEKNGDRQTYQVIQAVYDLATEVQQKAKGAGIVFDFTVGREECSSPNPFYNQTKTGVALFIMETSFKLATPLGDVGVFNCGICSGTAHLSVAEVFVKRFKATFQGFSRVMSKGADRIYEVIPSEEILESPAIREIPEETLREISKDEVKMRIGKTALVISPVRYSIYQLREVKGEILPKVSLLEDSKFRSFDLIHRIWSMIEKEKA